MKIFDFLHRRIENFTFEIENSTEAKQAYFKNLALQIAISYIANAISKCEFKVFERGKPMKNELYYALNVSPNPNQSSSQFINNLIENYFYHGECLVISHNNKYLYCADSYSVEKVSMGNNIFKSVIIEEQMQDKEYSAENVFLFKLDNVNVKYLIDGVYNQYSEVMQSAIQSFKRANGKKYKLALENVKAGDSTFNEVFEKVIKKQMKNFLENDNTVIPQYKGMDLQQFESNSSYKSATSDDVLTIRKEMFDLVSQAFKIPVSMMYGNVTNMDEIIKVFISICIDPIADMLSEELTRKTTRFEEWKKGTRVVVDTSCISHRDLFEVADKADKLLASGIADINELRSRLDMDVLKDEFAKTHFITKNYSKVEDLLKEPEQVAPAPSVVDDDNNATGNSDDIENIKKE